jgi:3-methyladenine DNA glycosylase/8-oxoguanine DNA glycosylase
MTSTTTRFRPPEDFHLWHSAFSHGWYDLAPFEADRSSGRLGRLLLLSNGSTAATSLSERGENVIIRVTPLDRLPVTWRKEVRGQWRTMLRCDEDLGEFHQGICRLPRYRWIARNGAGRLLRSPTVFEDVVKMLCTTNCTWGSTRGMVLSLVRGFGREFGGGHWAFPAPEAIAGATDSILRSRSPVGYRAPYILAFARQVASGAIDPEAWRTFQGETEELFTRIRSIQGVGPYAAGNLLKLLGRYDYLGLDAWVRNQYAVLHHRGRRVGDRTIERAYAPYGRWRGLVFWLEMTKEWHEEKFGGGR